MKKLLLALLICALCVYPALCFAESENGQSDDAIVQEEQEVVLGEGDILMHGYIDPYTDYYLGVPAEWAILGPGSTKANLAEAVDIMDDMDVYGIFRAFTTQENSALICRSKTGEGLTVTCGKSDAVTNDTLINSMAEIQAGLKANLSGLEFKEDCGKYSFKSVMDILFLDMTYKNSTIYQYYLVTGNYMYIFTFTNTSPTIAQTVLSTFQLTNGNAES